MTDPQQALEELSRLTTRAQRHALSLPECMRMVEQVRLAPGYIRRVAHTLGAQRNAAAVEALLTLPPAVPGVVEGLHNALAHGVARLRHDHTACPKMLAMDFRRSRSRGFEDVLARARTLQSQEFEALLVAGRVHYRFVLSDRRGTLAGRAAAASADLQWLHARLSKWSGTRLWLNGWSFASDGPFRAPVQVHLVRAWLTWAASQTTTRT
jgi:hypothetical protein